MKIDWNALGNLSGQLTAANSPANSQRAMFGRTIADQFAAQQEQAAMKKAEEERKKKERGKLFGKLGSTVGTIAGVALAPVTGGASLAIPAAMGAAGGALGGTAGQLVGGGGFDFTDTLGYAADGALGGAMGGMSAGFGKAGQTAFNAAGNVGPAVAPTSMDMVKGMFSGGRQFMANRAANTLVQPNPGSDWEFVPDEYGNLVARRKQAVMGYGY
jgi:hypothetical protein